MTLTLLLLLAQQLRPDLPPIPTYEVHRAKVAPTINGHLDDAAWQKAKPVEFIFPWADQTGKKQRTIAKLAWDNDYLYVAYECDDTDIIAVHTNHDDPTYKDDAVEIFIGPSNAANFYLGLEMNAHAVLYDYFYAFPTRLLKNYDLRGVQLAVSIRGTLNLTGDEDKGWNLEVAIPWRAFSDLADRPVPQTGDRWMANLNRWDGTEPTRRLSQWSDSGLLRPNPHNPARFGQLLFTE